MKSATVAARASHAFLSTVPVPLLLHLLHGNTEEIQPEQLGDNEVLPGKISKKKEAYQKGVLVNHMRCNAYLQRVW